MAWLTLADLIARFGAGAVADLQAGGADAAVAIADAQAECEGYLARAVGLPIATPGAALLRLACDVARYNLWRRDLPSDHPVVIAYRQSISDLSDISAGRLSLPGVVGAPADGVTPSAGWAVKASPAVFTDARLALMESPLLTPGGSL